MEFTELESRLASLQQLCSLQQQHIEQITCHAIQRNGDRCNQPCVAGKTCQRHTLRMKPDGPYLRLYGTNVLLNQDHQVIGYRKNNVIHWSENQDVRNACEQYDLVFCPPYVDQVD